MTARRFPLPWTVEDHNSVCFIVRDGNDDKRARQGSQSLGRDARMSAGALDRKRHPEILARARLRDVPLGAPAGVRGVRRRWRMGRCLDWACVSYVPRELQVICDGRHAALDFKQPHDMKRLNTRDEAPQIAANIVKLPELLKRP
jgi:hypothetical protein